MTPERVFSALAAIAALISLPASAGAQQAAPPPAPVLEYEGAVATGIALRRLGNTARLLHVGAHPDDENTAIFSPLALGRGAEAAYLSLNRGEGGQNGIGAELGIPLGLIRSEELLAARRLDGATQFFTRAVDYGFSKDASEAFRHWPRDSLLADVVAVIRRYRPDVVIPAWTGTPRDGHGQHQAAGLLTRDAVLAAGDPTRFPEQIAAGLRPHTPRAYYWSARYGDDGADVELNTGFLDPLLGRSYHEVAMASRSRHRSQDMGVPQARGPRHTAFDAVDPAAPPEVVTGSGGARQLEGAAGADVSLFVGVDTLLSQRARNAQRAGTTDVDADARALISHLVEYEREVEMAKASFDPLAPAAMTRGLLDARRHLDAAREALGQGGGATAAGIASAAGTADLRFHLADEANDLRDATIAVANLRLEVVSDQELVVPGQTFRLTLTAWNGGASPVAITPAAVLPSGWTARPAAGDPDDPDDAAGAGARRIPSGELVAVTYEVTVPEAAELTRPYFLGVRGGATEGDLYDWPEDYAIRGLPFAPSPVRGRFTIDFSTDSSTDQRPGGRSDYAIEVEATWLGLDPRSGEFRRPVRVVPAVSVSVSPTTTVIPLARATDDPGRATIPLSVRLLSEAPDGIAGTLRPVLPAGWTATPASAEIAFRREGEDRTLSFAIAPPPGLTAGLYEVRAEFRAAGGNGATFDLGYQLVDYPHIAPHHLYRPATAHVRALDVKVADVRVGYVAGVGDGVPEALDQMGVEWSAVGETELAGGDLSGFDVIIAGTRAYEVRPDLVAHNERLLDWARAGGTLISLYNKYPALAGSYAPWPVSIARPHGRVTDEDAPVTVLEPDHPIFNTPNRIGPADWDGWVQERGLYFWDAWEGPLRPLLAMNDPGEAPLEGSLLVAPLGEGTYVYAALALFRQLPEGVPGSYRLLANLVSLGAAR
ncbi:MAG: PIG-L family deacetylase [Gemmatimonadota bacterium]